MKKVTSADVIQFLGKEIINKTETNINRRVKGSYIFRAGLELSTNTFSKTYEKYIMGWGTKEGMYLDTLTDEQVMNRAITLISENRPLVILSEGFLKNTSKAKIILDRAEEVGVPVIEVSEHLSEVSGEVSTFIASKNINIESVHGSLVVINGIGVMIKGKSGIGKSEAVLELIQQGHVFVSDDTVNIWRFGSKFKAKGSPLTSGLLEARGIGIVNVPLIYGIRSTVEETDLDFVVELVPSEDMHEVDRLGNRNLRYEVHGGGIPMTQIPTGQGRSVASLIVAATHVFIAKEQGFDPLEEIMKRREAHDGE